MAKKPKAGSNLRGSVRVQAAAAALTSNLQRSDKVRVWTVVGPLLAQWKWPLLLAILLNALHGLAITLQNLTPKWLIDDVLLAEGLDGPTRLRLAIILGLVYFCFSFFGRMLMWHLGFRLFTRIRERMVFVLRGRFFRHVNALCLRFHGRHPSGELFAYLFGSPLATIMQFYQHASMHLAGAVFTIVSTLVVIGFWDPLLTVVLFLTALASVWVMQIARKRMRAINKDFQNTEGDVGGHVADLLRGNKAVKLYAMEEMVAEDFDRDAQLLGSKTYQRDITGHVQFMKQETVNYIAYALLIVICAWRFVQGEAEPGVVAAVLASFQGLTGPLALIFQTVTLWGGAEASIERIGTVLKTASTTPEPEGEALPVPASGDLHFERVSFAYELDGPAVIKDLTLTIPYGQRVALVGPSGAGKSTITQLLLRLYDPRDGSITLDGVDLRKLSSVELRRHFGVVPQDPFVFRTSIRENLRVARSDASEAEMLEALRRANAYDFVMAMKQGLDTPVGEGGSTISGGQKQRLSIARALLANPAFFIFDEATSALDSDSERLIQHTLEQELGAATAIFIAHRLSTVKNCHRILVIADGGILQDGTFSELLAQPGMFRNLVEGQKLVH